MKNTIATVSVLLCGFAALRACSQKEQGNEDRGQEAVVTGEEVPVLGTRIDRIGRPEVTNFLIRSPVIKEGYNADDSFAVSEENIAKYTGMFKASLAMYDNN